MPNPSPALILGGAGRDYLYGGAGNDTFLFRPQDFLWNEKDGGDTVMDFGGAGAYFATNNDFIAFDGFGPGATLTFTGVSVHNPNLQYYDLSWNGGANHAVVSVVSLNGAQLNVHHDYNFYG